jgi:pimeloyl-ACP methyl ester carboxylesterase
VIIALRFVLTQMPELTPIINATAQTGVFGHSMGGAAAIVAASTSGEINKVNLGAAVAMHPGIQFGNLSPLIPTLYFTGTIDIVCGPLLVKPQYALAALHNVPRGYAEFRGYTHTRPMGNRSNNEIRYVRQMEC